MSNKIEFISGCPGFGCNNTKVAFTWVHSNCGGYEWLFDDGNVKCKKCNLELPLISWKFACKGHSDYREANKQKICEILSISASLEKSDLNFQANMMKAISRMMLS
jgi:hypothetical protein